MTVQAMRGLLQQRLMTLGWEDQTVFEGRQFTPTPGVPYQEVATTFAEPDPITLSHSDQQRGEFQIRLLYPLVATDGSGTAQTGIGAPTARAQEIADAFPRNLKLASGSVTVKITRKPWITRGPPQGDRDVTIIRLRFSDR